MAGGRRSRFHVENPGCVRFLSGMGFDATDASPVLSPGSTACAFSEAASRCARCHHWNCFFVSSPSRCLDDAGDHPCRNSVDIHVLSLPLSTSYRVLSRRPGLGFLLWNFRSRSRDRVESALAIMLKPERG